MDAQTEIQSQLLGPIVAQWVARIKAADRAKTRFTTIAKLCRQFFGSSAKAMWEDDFRKEFYPTLQTPMFQVNLNKAFELVAIIGPTLYWKNPERQVKSYKTPDQTPLAMMLGVQDEEMLQQVQAMQQQVEQIKEQRNSLASLVLEFMQNEQAGSLKKDVELCINEFLLTGLGTIWTESYRHPATQELLSRNRYGSVDDLQVDPDCRMPDWSDARWISRTHYEPVWMAERRFGYPPGYLTGRGTRMSAEYQVNRDSVNPSDRYCDMIEWHEIWSRGGIGARIGGVHAQQSQFLDSVVGDNCYLCVTPNVPHPLNIPPMLLQGGSVEEVQEAVRWRTTGFGAIHEMWKDNRWPCTPLSSYPVPNSPWPLAILAPGLGHLIAMNIIMVTKLNQAWDKRREIIGVASEMKDTLTAALRTDESPCVIPISHQIGKNMTELIQRLDRGDTQDDLLQWMEYLGNEFAKATGLLDIHYGMTQTQTRVTGDIEAKKTAAGIRPEKMREDIVEWVRNFSTSELWLVAQHVEGSQLKELLGEWGAYAWETLVRAMPFEQLIREMTCYIDAKDIQRPDNARDLDALERISQSFMLLASEYAQASGDTGPINGFLRRWYEAMDLRQMDDMYFGPWMGQPDPQAQAIQQQMAQLQMAESQAKTSEIQAKTVGRLTDTQFKMRGVTPAMMLKMQQDQMKFNQKLQQDKVNHLQQLLQNEELFAQTLQQLRAQAAVKARGTAS
jgi:hypothetical protein